MPSAPNRLSNLRNLQISNWDVTFSTAFASLVGGSLLIGFIQELGGGDFAVQLSIALPSLIGLAQIPGAIWGRSFPFYRKFIAPGGWIWRLLYIPLAILPLAPIPNDIKLVLLFVCIGVATLCNSTVGATYNEWIADMVPAESRGWYYSRRTLVVTASSALIALLGGVSIDFFARLNNEPLGFTTTFGLGVLMGLTSMIFFLKMEDTPRLNPVKPNVKESLRQLQSPFKDKNYRIVLIFTTLFAASQGLAGGLYTTYARESLGLPFTIIQLFAVSHALATVFCVKIWGFLSDKYGSKPILVISAAGTVITPGLWLLTHPGPPTINAIILIAGHLFNGLVWSGVAISQANFNIATARDEDKANYLAAAATVSAVSIGISSFIGSGMMSALRVQMPAEAAYKIVFAAVMGLRFLSMIPLAPIKEKGARNVRETMSQLTRVSPRGIRAFRAIQSSSDVVERERALAGVGSSGFALGSDELLKALDDPSPRIRRQAAYSLGQMANPEIVRAVIDHLEAHPDLAQEETLEVLGECRLPESVPVLARYLEDPRSILRRSAARSLGRLGDPSAIEPLKEAAREAGDPDLRRAAIQGLRLLYATDAADVIGEALFDAHPSIRVAAAEAVSELELTELAPTLRESIQWFQDETASEMSYALGVVGQIEDIPLILEVAGEMVSPTLRRRCLMGVARLLDVERGFYQMLALEGIGRDDALLRFSRSAKRGGQRLKVALERYSSGDEPDALRLLARTARHPALEMMAEQPVEEAFLAAYLFAAGSDPASAEA